MKSSSESYVHDVINGDSSSHQHLFPLFLIPDWFAEANEKLVSDMVG